MYVVRQASRRSWRIGQTPPVKVVFMSYRNTLQADALKLVAKKMQSSLAVEGELPEDGLAAYGDDGDDMMMALARRIVSGEEEDEAETMEEVFAQARNAESEAEELLVDDGWKVVEVEPETIAVNGNGNGHHDLRANSRACPGQGARQRQRERPRARAGQLEREQRPPRRDLGAACLAGRQAADAVLLGGVHGRGAGETRRAGAGSQSPQPRPCSSGRSPLSRKERRSRSARGARPQHTGGGRRYVSDDLPLRNHVCGLFCVSALHGPCVRPFSFAHFPVGH